MTTKAEDYPFAQEFITDAEGHIRKFVVDVADYQKLLQALEDEGLGASHPLQLYLLYE